MMRRVASLGLLALACATRPAPAPPHATPAPRGSAPRGSAPRAVPTPAAPVAAAAPCPPLTARVPLPPNDPIDAPQPAIVDDAGELDPFHRALAALERDRRPVRIAIYGDSNLTLDGVSGAFRRDLQARFGDAGHGFVGLGTPFRGYRHEDVRHTMIGHWDTFIFTRGAKPARGGFGIAGMAVTSRAPRARFRIATAEDGAPVGVRASRFGVFYLEAPEAGRFALRANGEPKKTVSASGPEEAVRFVSIEVEDGPATFEIENLERAPVHLYGSVVERDVPGIIVDSFGVTGSTYGTLSKLDGPDVTAALALRPHDLVVFMLGTNFWNSKENPEGLARLVALHRAREPPPALLVVAPPDHVKTKRSMRSDPRVIKVVEQLSTAAREQRVAWWDLRAAMGGDGSMWVFHQRGLAGDDLYHLTSAGAHLLGRRFAFALLSAHAQWIERHPKAGCRSSTDVGGRGE